MSKWKVVVPVGAALALAIPAAPAFAQDGYMFGPPRSSLTLRAGAARPAANDDIFRTFTDQLTLDRGDFAAMTFGADLGVRVTPQLDFVLSVSVAHSSNDSEFRDFVEDNDQPIEQTTELTSTPLTAGLKVHLLPRGRSLGRYAWVPARLSPYVGGGAGVLFYKLEQAGDFVDFETLDIFTDHFESDGATLTGHVLAGGDLWLIPRLGLNVEARYSWAKADLHGPFLPDFPDIDLRGWQLTAGLTLRY